MEIADLVTPAGVVPSLKASSKKQALQELARKASDLSTLDEREIFDALLERERLGTTGVGMGIAIPHSRFAKLTRLVGLFARLDKPIAFDSVDEQPVDLKAFLAWYTFRDVRDAEAAGEDRVRLMTIHAAKGLEAPIVHFIGPDGGRFPKAGEDERGEELRLWYVAVTRARDYFIAHTADEIAQSWGSGVTYAGQSPFLRYLTAEPAQAVAS